MSENKKMNDMLQSAINGKRRTGQADLIKYLKGERLLRSHAEKAKCYDCDGMGESGICDIDTCSLFPYSPYRRSGKKIHQRRGHGGG